MSLIGALGGMGEAGVQIGMQNMRDWAAQDLAKQRDDAEAERQKSLIRLKMDMEQQQKDAPLNRLGEKAKEFAAAEVPVQADSVKALIGSMPDGAGGQRTGMKGDIETLKKMADKLPDADRQPYLDQLAAQQAGDQAKADSAVAGKTRKLTGDESLAKAVEWARANDLPAVAAYESQIGKPMRDDRRLDNQERRDDSRIDLEKQRIKTEQDRTVIMDKKLDNQEAAQQRRDERQDKFMEIQEKRLTQQSDKADAQSQRASVTALMTSTERELERTMTLAKDPMLSDAEKTMFQSRATSLQKDLGRYRAGLESMGGDAIPKAAEPTKPKNTFDSSTGDVTADGTVIGKAKTPEEAKKMLTDYTKSEGEKKAKAPAPEASPLIGASPAPTENKPLNTIDAMTAEKVDSLRPLAAEFKQAEQAFLAAAKSGDQASVSKYLSAKEALRKELDGKAQSMFGNGADKILKTLYGN